MAENCDEVFRPNILLFFFFSYGLTGVNNVTVDLKNKSMMDCFPNIFTFIQLKKYKNLWHF